MRGNPEQTKETILACARSEFLVSGFRNASLRNIAKATELTTGAIYRHFSDKDALFCAATQGVVDSLEKAYTKQTDDALKAIRQGVAYGQEDAQSNVTVLFDIIYDHFDEFYLIVMCSAGSSRERYIEGIIEYEHTNTLAYARELIRKHHSSFEIDEVAIHMLTEALVGALLEPVRHRMDKEDAMRRLTFIHRFFSDGWRTFEERIIKDRQ